MTIYTLITSPRIPAGLLSATAWRLVTTHPVYATDDDDLAAAIRDAGGLVTILAGDPTAEATALVRRGETVVWLAGESAKKAAFAKALAAAVVMANEPELEVVYGSWDPAGARLLDVVTVLDRLRSPGGCPWDAEQTHRSLMPYLLEEAYEAYDAIDSGNREEMIEELGDVLLQAVFHARLGAELDGDQRWTIDDVAAALVKKLVGRHPHVFADATADTAGEVTSNWEEIKRAEKKRTSALDGVARSQPALSLAAKYVSKVERFGVDVQAPKPPTGVAVPDDAEDLGDLLLAIVATATATGLDAEAALRAAADRFAGRVKQAELD